MTSHASRLPLPPASGEDTIFEFVVDEKGQWEHWKNRVRMTILVFTDCFIQNVSLKLTPSFFTAPCSIVIGASRHGYNVLHGSIVIRARSDGYNLLHGGA